MSSAPTGTPSTSKLTPLTPTLSEASALIVTVPETDEPSAGAVRETMGGVLSAGGGVTVPASSSLPASGAAPVGRGSPSASTAGKRTGSAASLAQVSELARCPSGFPPPNAGTGWAKLTVQSFGFEPHVEPPGAKTLKANVPPPQLATTLWKMLP